MTHQLRYPVDAPFMDTDHKLLAARKIAADPLVYTKPARAEALETLQCWGDAGDDAGITSLCLSLAEKPDDPGWGHPVMMLLYAVLLIVVGFLLRGVV